jgi:retron-type reverse transcriptase
MVVVIVTPLELAELKHSERWLSKTKATLFRLSRDHRFRAVEMDLTAFITDARNLHMALWRVSHNRGRSTPGIDGKTVRDFISSAEQLALIATVRDEILPGRYKSSPVKRKWIPKPGKPDEKRGLGIPTFENRVVNAAILNIIEPIFEARFLENSVGFRPRRGVPRGRRLVKEALRSGKFEWVIEADIEKCFDQIDHTALMKRFSLTIGDQSLTELIWRFLKAGIMEDSVLSPTDRGVPQGI